MVEQVSVGRGNALAQSKDGKLFGWNYSAEEDWEELVWVVDDMKMAEQLELGILGCHLISLIRIKKNSNGVCV